MLSVFAMVKESSSIIPSPSPHLPDRNQPGDQDWSSLIPENFVRQLGFSDEAEPHGIELEYQRHETDHSSRHENGHAMLTRRTMTQPGYQDGSLLTEENVARQLGFSDEAKLQGIEHEYQRRGVDHSSRQESGYATLTPHKTMVTAIKVSIKSGLKKTSSKTVSL